MSEDENSAVRAAADATKQVRDTLRSVHSNPEESLGLTSSELSERRRKALQPRLFVNAETNRSFDVKSSSYATQVMQRGVVKNMHDKRQREMQKSMRLLRKFQIGIGLFGVCFMTWFVAQYLVPHYSAVQERNRVMHMRQERAMASIDAYIREREQHDSPERSPENVIS